jgi:hypothetical protein
MRKAIKIILAIFGALIILAAIFGALFFLDLASYTATGSQELTPAGHSTGKALVVYDPGLSANSKNIADKIADNLLAKNYTVTLAGIKSKDASKTAGYATLLPVAQSTQVHQHHLSKTSWTTLIQKLA